MGDVRTHFTVTSFVRQQLEKELPAGILTARDYTYLELGNFLTDVSQFRDPPAHHKARDEIWHLALGKGVIPIFGPLLVLIFGVTGWTEAIFGQGKPGQRHGALAQFFEHVVLAVTQMAMAEDGIASYRGGVFSSTFPNLVPLPPAEIDRVFQTAFTQYWPHEHLDFPPVRDLEDHRKKKRFQASQRGRIGYLERHIQFISEELSKLELELLSALKTNAPETQRQDLLVRLGNLLHPVEDYFFHSNFVEMRQWQHVIRQNRDQDPTTVEGRHALALKGLTGTGLPENSVRLRRLLYRRLRYPEYEDRETPSEESSDAATEFVYTGGFGKTDIFHTIGSAIEAFEAGVLRVEREAGALGPVSDTAADAAESAKNLRDHDLILVRLIFNQDERRRMVEEDLAEDHADLHKKQVIAGEYHEAIRAARRRGKLSARAEEELLAAFDLDKKMEDEWIFFPGIGGLLIQILNELELTRREAEDASDQLDRHPESIFDERTLLESASGRTASSETIGTHSLMSKDSADKQPLREDALVMARHASASVAVLLMKRATENKNTRLGIDWDTLLRFYLRKPKATTASWYNELRQSLRRAGRNFAQPDVKSLRSQPNYSLLGPGRQQRKLQDRRVGTTRQKLEENYRSFED
jgi:hypothetical protein